MDAALKPVETESSDTTHSDPLNNSTLHQVWTLHKVSSTSPTAVVHITSKYMRPGVWLLHTPLDGKAA